MGRPLGLRGTAAYDGPVALIAAIVSGSADLRGAACTARPRLFDPDVPAEVLGYSSKRARVAAIEMTCVGCPVRSQCWQWSREIPASRVVGPTAATSYVGAVIGGRGPRRAAPAVPEPEDPEGGIEAQRPAQRRGARSKVRPSINRKRRRNRRRR